MNEATIELQFPNPEAAENARRALEPDNDGILRATVTGSTLHLATDSESIMGLLRTLDDALSCLRATGMD